MQARETGHAASTSRIGTRMAARRSLATAATAAGATSNGSSAARGAVAPSSGIRLRPRTSTSSASPVARTGLFAQSQAVPSSSQSSVITRSRAASTTSRARRVLVQPKDRAAVGPSLPSSASSSSVQLSGSADTKSAAKTASSSTTRARRLSRAEASQITGMGIVRAGPAVMGHRTASETNSSHAGSHPGSHPLPLDTGSASDPFSTAFVRPPLPFTSDFKDSTVGGAARLFEPLPATAASAFTSTAFLSPIREANAVTPYDLHLTAPSALLRNARIAPHSPTRSPSRMFQIFDDGAASLDTDDKLPSGPCIPYVASRATTVPLEPQPSAASSRKRSVDTLHSDEPVGGSSHPTTPSKRAPKRLHTGAPKVSEAVKTVDAPGDIDFTGVASSTLGAPHASPRAVSPALPRYSPRSVPMQRTGGRIYSLPDLTVMPVSASPRLFVSRAQLCQDKQPIDDNATSMPSSLGVLCSDVSQPSPGKSDGCPTAPSLAPLPPLSVAPPGPSPSTHAPATSNLILPTLSLFDPDRIATDTTSTAAAVAATDGDTTMSDTGDVSTGSSSTATSSRADETARRLANLQSMLSQLQVPKPSSAGPAASATLGARRVSTGAKAEHARAQTSTMPPPPVASHTARRASMVKAKGFAGAVRGSTSAPNLHRGPPIQPGSARRESLAGPTTLGGGRSAKSSSERVSASRNPSTLAPGTAPLRASSAGNDPSHRAARGKTCLQGVVAFVDVRTAEGDDSGMIFVDMLKDLGARVSPPGRENGFPARFVDFALKPGHAGHDSPFVADHPHRVQVWEADNPRLSPASFLHPTPAPGRHRVGRPLLRAAPPCRRDTLQGRGGRRHFRRPWWGQREH